MKTMNIKMWAWAVVALLGCMAVTACGDDKEEELNISDVIVGTWVIGTDADGNPDYTIEQSADDPVEYGVNIDHLELKADGSFVMWYDADGQDTDRGTYEAGHDYLTFYYIDEQGTEEPLLWQLLGFTANTLTARYKDTDHDITVTVTMVKR